MSCLFNSLDNALSINNSRKIICHYIENNLDEKINGETINNWIQYASNDMNSNVKDYIDKMKYSSTWGGGPELMIASKLFNVIINISFNGKTIEFNNTNSNNSEKIFINYNGSHYWNNNSSFLNKFNSITNNSRLHTPNITPSSINLSNIIPSNSNRTFVNNNQFFDNNLFSRNSLMPPRFIPHNYNNMPVFNLSTNMRNKYYYNNRFY